MIKKWYYLPLGSSEVDGVHPKLRITNRKLKTLILLRYLLHPCGDYIEIFISDSSSSSGLYSLCCGPELCYKFRT